MKTYLVSQSKTVRILLAALCLTVALCSCAPQSKPAPKILRSYSYTLEGSAAQVRETEQSLDGSLLRSKTFEMPDGDTVFAGTVTLEDGAEACLLEWDADSVQLHWSDGTDWHEEIPEGSGSYLAGCLFVDTEAEHFAIYLPQCCEHIENGCVRYLPDRDGRLDVTANEDGSRHLALIARGGGEQTSSDFFLARCKDPIIDWADGNQTNFWKAYTNRGDGRFLYSGYYWISSTLNETSGENIYANNVACYFGKSFVYGAPFYDAMKDMSLFLMDAMLDNQNEQGYWPSNVVSSWLHEDYGIDGPYYDTRFNSDFVKILMRSCREFGIEEYKEPLRRYFAFYKEFANGQGWELEGGLAVPDYYYPGMTTPHMALNHQLAEIDVLYEAAELLGDGELSALGDTMLAALENSAPQWIKSDNNLHYSVHPDGEYGGQDYPYLTYNDLFDMQNRLQAMGRPRSEALQLLMDAKKAWMDRNGVTGYKQ